MPNNIFGGGGYTPPPQTAQPARAAAPRAVRPVTAAPPSRMPWSQGKLPPQVPPQWRQPAQPQPPQMGGGDYQPGRGFPGGPPIQTQPAQPQPPPRYANPMQPMPMPPPPRYANPMQPMPQPMPQPPMFGGGQPMPRYTNPMQPMNDRGRPVASQTNLLPNQQSTGLQRMWGGQRSNPNPATANPQQPVRGLMQRGGGF